MTSSTISFIASTSTFPLRWWRCYCFRLLLTVAMMLSLFSLLFIIISGAWFDFLPICSVFTWFMRLWSRSRRRRWPSIVILLRITLATSMMISSMISASTVMRIWVMVMFFSLRGFLMVVWSLMRRWRLISIVVLGSWMLTTTVFSTAISLNWNSLFLRRF